MARIRWTSFRFVPVAMVGMVTMLGLAGCGRSDPNDRPAEPEPSPVPTAPAPRPLGPAQPSMAASPNGERTTAGALTAAIAFVTNGQALLDMDPAAVERTVRAGAAAETADAQVREIREGIAAVHAALASGTGPIRYRQAALATRVMASSPDRARVAVWHVAVLSRAGIAPPQAAWAISVVDLVWEVGGWKLVSEQVTPGPTPMTDNSAVPVTAAEIDAALDGFSPAGT